MIIFKLPFILLCMLLALLCTVFKIVIITLFVCLFIWFTESGPSSGTNIYQDVSFSKDYKKIKGAFKSAYEWFLKEAKSI